jgi:hypothetical protein
MALAISRSSGDSTYPTTSSGNRTTAESPRRARHVGIVVSDREREVPGGSTTERRSRLRPPVRPRCRDEPSAVARRSPARSAGPWRDATPRLRRRHLTVLDARCVRLRSPLQAIGEPHPARRRAQLRWRPHRVPAFARVDGAPVQPVHAPQIPATAWRTVRPGPAVRAAGAWFVACWAHGQSARSRYPSHADGRTSNRRHAYENSIRPFGGRRARRLRPCRRSCVVVGWRRPLVPTPSPELSAEDRGPRLD